MQPKYNFIRFTGHSKLLSSTYSIAHSPINTSYTHMINTDICIYKNKMLWAEVWTINETDKIDRCFVVEKRDYWPSMCMHVCTCIYAYFDLYSGQEVRFLSWIGTRFRILFVQISAQIARHIMITYSVDTRLYMCYVGELAYTPIPLRGRVVGRMAEYWVRFDYRQEERACER